jgi:putative tryptophan/tyrosine transport system substrate-binding protein
MKRREFIAGLGSAAAWPSAAHAQQPDRRRRVGVLMGFDENDAEAKSWLSGFVQMLAELGWTDGRNVLMDVRWARGNLERMRTLAKELVELRSDVILSPTTPVTAALQRETRTIPIIFVIVADPVGEGFVASIPRPARNLTGFMLYEPTMAGKWMELLTQIAPGLSRVAFMFNPDAAAYATSYLLPSFEAAARSLKVEPIVAPTYNSAEIETLITSLAGEPRCGLVINADPFTEVHRALIVSLAAQNSIPSVCSNSGWTRAGGLVSFNARIADEFNRAASYVDRILRGSKPSDLPVQLPVKFEIVLNTKTAKALGLTIPETLLATADEVIQ